MSKSRKFRTKLSFQDDEEEAQPQQPQPASAAPVAKAPSRPSLLSFGDDDDALAAPAAASKKKKEKLKSKFASANVTPTPPDAPDAGLAHRPAAGEYTSERLAELRVSQQRAPTPSGAQGAGGAAGALRLKLSGSFKPAGPPQDDRFTISTAPLPAVPDVDGEMPLPPPPPRRTAQGGGVSGAGGDAGPDGGGGGGGGLSEPLGVLAGLEEEDEEAFAIPNDDTIRLAKAKRERLRQAHLAPDYIPLGGASRLMALRASDFKPADGGTGGGSGSGSDEEQEEQLRLQFGAGGKAKAAAAVGEYTTAVADDEEEEDAFASEQLRKAIRRNQGAAAPSQPAAPGRCAAAVFGTPAAEAVAGAASVAAGGGGGVSTAAAAARGLTGRGRMEAMAAAGQGVMAALQEALTRAQLSHKAVASNLARTGQNLNHALDSIERVREELAAAGERFSYVQRMKAYVADLCDCLQHKAALIEELEEHLAGLRAERAAAERGARDADLAVLTAQGEAATAAALGVLAEGGAADDATAAAAAAAAAEGAEAAAIEAAVAAGGGGGAEGGGELDEFGRDVGLMRRRQLQQASEQRQALVQVQLDQLRHIAAGGRLDLNAPDVPPSSAAAAEAARYAARRAEALDAAATLFADADDEFSSLAAVRARLEDWKRRYPRDYDQAYVSESAPALFAPFVRLEMLAWDLFAPPPGGSGGGCGGGGTSGGGGGFDSHDWYQQLFEYGVQPGSGGGGGGGGDGGDADANLVPALVESLVLPLALKLAADVWQPCDATQSTTLAALASDLFVYVPADAEGMGELLRQLTARLERAADAVRVPLWPAGAAAASPLAQAVLHLRFKAGTRLLAGVAAFRELLGLELLQRLALGGVAGRHLVPAVRARAAASLASGVAYAEAVVTALPREWFAAGGAPASAQPLIDLLLGMARSMEQEPRAAAAAAGGVVVAERLAVRLAGLLAHVGQSERGRQLLAAFGRHM